MYIYFLYIFRAVDCLLLEQKVVISMFDAYFQPRKTQCFFNCVFIIYAVNREYSWIIILFESYLWSLIYNQANISRQRLHLSLILAS